MAQDPQALLTIHDLAIEFDTDAGPVRAVEGLGLSVRAGRTLAVVGESGSGKSVTSLAIMRLIEHVRGRIASGEIVFSPPGQPPVDLAQLAEPAMRAIRGNDIAMIFQEPMTSLNPVFPVGDQIAEALAIHRGLGRRAAREEGQRLFERLRLPDAHALIDRYPHELSGGMRQRVMIAMALACRPRLLIADEPTTALDVTIQAQILNMIRALQREMEMAVIFITHDMGVVAEIADDVVVMWQGRKVEEGTVEAIFRAPKHPYTQALLDAVPKLGSMAGERHPRRTALTVMKGGAAQKVGADHIQETADYSRPLTSVDGLVARFDVRRGSFGGVTHRVHAVENVSFEIFPGETLALVGESGSGKSTIGRMLQQLLVPTGGTIRFGGRPIAAMSPTERHTLRRQVQSIFQDPFASLDPRKTIGFSIAEPIVTHRLISGRKAITRRVHELLEQVGLTAEHARRYPHEFSGGQRQRICIARALASEPRLIIADEALSALDVSIQAQIINLFMELQERQGLSYLFISHDMAVVEKMSHRVAVLYLGQIVEMGSRLNVFETPSHPYTRRLLAAVPVAEPGRHIDTSLIEGEIPSTVRKIGDAPEILPLEEIGPGHFVSRETRPGAPGMTMNI